MSDEPTAIPNRQAHLSRWIALLVAGGLMLYLVGAYVVVPLLWKGYAHRHPALDDVPGITETKSGIPGDPINVGLIGAKANVIKIMLAATWHPADALSLESCLEIAEATVLKRPYEDAPVSNLYLWGRKEDLAFEQEVGADPRHRHHVRFWQSSKVDAQGQPLWFGSVTYDKGVGLSHTTGQITHHIDADVDAERDRLFRTLQETGELADRFVVEGFHKKLEGRNGGGDPWHTDGNLWVGVIKR